jgi:uncharacterized protein (DUF302 family)
MKRERLTALVSLVVCVMCAHAPNLRAVDSALEDAPSITDTSCDADSDITTRVSHYSVEETMSRLQKSIEHAGLTVLIIVGQGVAADPSAMEAQQLIVLTDPRTRTLLTGATPLIALDLPIKMLVWRDGDLVKVSFKEVDCIRQRYDLTPQTASFFGLVDSSVQRALR